ncbi:hypothetical protein JTB14_013759 [Gonioctena quinquepunctata]|nr:hypothetical protein JTB14_013759 [Gonioctena quinquepunctata]
MASLRNNKNWKRPLTTSEILEEIERLDEDDLVPDEIVLLPPSDGEESAENSRDEECIDPNRLGAAQLRAPAEVF